MFIQPLSVALSTFSFPFIYKPLYMCDELSCLPHTQNSFLPFHKMRVWHALCVDVILQQLRDTNA